MSRVCHATPCVNIMQIGRTSFSTYVRVYKNIYCPFAISEMCEIISVNKLMRENMDRITIMREWIIYPRKRHEYIFNRIKIISRLRAKLIVSCPTEKIAVLRDPSAARAHFLFLLNLIYWANITLYEVWRNVSK